MESLIVDFHQDLYIPTIKTLAFNLPRVCIIGTHTFDNICRESFKHRSYFQDVLCRLDYEERVVARFAHRIQS